MFFRRVTKLWDPNFRVLLDVGCNGIAYESIVSVGSGDEPERFVRCGRFVEICGGRGRGSAERSTVSAGGEEGEGRT